MNQGLKKLKEGDFNTMQQTMLDDGSVLVELSKRGENKTYKFTVKNLYKKGEKVLSEEVITHA